MDILISIVAKVAEYTVAPIGRQLGYLFFYHKNIKDVEKQLENLKTTREKVQILVNEARSNAYEIYDEVSTWLLAEVDVELRNMPLENKGVSNRKGSNTSCLNFVQRHKLSRRSKKRVKDILEIIEKGKKFDKVGYPAPLPDTKSSTLPADYQILESRTLLAEKIKDSLADPNVNKVGVCGMGGVGKTKLLDEVKKLVLENKLFDRVIDVTIGQSNGVVEIQDQIGGKLNMGLNMKAGTKEGRAPFLRNKLVEMKDDILIMLDDLWDEYDLQKEVGIPCRSRSSKEGCKILMTSRSRDILTNRMDAEKCFEVNSLSEEESWKFFIAIVGEFDKNRIEHLARNVVKKCGGLPIALKIIAKALKGKDVRIWKDALEKLEKRVSVKIKGVSDQLYSCLKLSYDRIEDEETRLLFLLCSVFPDDHKIHVKDLQMYAMGMGLLNDIDNWETSRNMVVELVDHLKSSSLLLESNSGDNYVQMHDVVRDVAKYIATKENKMSSLSYGRGQSEWREKERCGSYNVIFIDCVDFPNLPPNMEFPDLQMLILRIQSFFGEGRAIQIPEALFEGMKKLRVLDMTKMCFEPSKTSFTHSLKNLQTLRMSYCECNDILTIFQLKKLEILRINGIMIITLQVSFPELEDLRSEGLSLETLWHNNGLSTHPFCKLQNIRIQYCNKLKYVFPSNVVTSLVFLKILEIYTCELLEGIFEVEKLTDEARATVPLTKLILISLPKLKYVWDKDPGEFLTFPNLRKVEVSGCPRLKSFVPTSFIRHMDETKTLVTDEASKLVVPEMVLSKGFGDENIVTLSVETSQESNFIQVKKCDKMNCLLPSSISFFNLNSLIIWECNGMINLFSSSVAKSLVSLYCLTISNCEEMSSIIAREEEEEKDEEIIFKKLTDLELDDLPRLANFYSGKYSLKFPCLNNLRITKCPKMKPFSYGIEKQEKLNGV